MQTSVQRGAKPKNIALIGLDANGDAGQPAIYWVKTIQRMPTSVQRVAKRSNIVVTGLDAKRDARQPAIYAQRPIPQKPHQASTYRFNKNGKRLIFDILTLLKRSHQQHNVLLQLIPPHQVCREL